MEKPKEIVFEDALHLESFINTFADVDIEGNLWLSAMSFKQLVEEIRTLPPDIHKVGPDYFGGAKEAAELGLKSGIPPEQLFKYVWANYRDVLNKQEVRSAVAEVLLAHDKKEKK